MPTIRSFEIERIRTGIIIGLNNVKWLRSAFSYTNSDKSKPRETAIFCAWQKTEESQNSSVLRCSLESDRCIPRETCDRHCGRLREWYFTQIQLNSVQCTRGIVSKYTRILNYNILSRGMVIIVQSTLCDHHNKNLIHKQPSFVWHTFHLVRLCIHTCVHVLKWVSLSETTDGRRDAILSTARDGLKPGRNPPRPWHDEK